MLFTVRQFSLKKIAIKIVIIIKTMQTTVKNITFIHRRQQKGIVDSKNNNKTNMWSKGRPWYKGAFLRVL